MLAIEKALARIPIVRGKVLVLRHVLVKLAGLTAKNTDTGYRQIRKSRGYLDTPLVSALMTELGPILSRLGLAQYFQSFIEEGFDTWETVLDITEPDLYVAGLSRHLPSTDS